MKLKCIRNQSKELPQEYLNVFYLNDVDYSVAITNKYFVYGISLWKGYLQYLIVSNESIGPNWYPSLLFEVIDNKIPEIWKYDFWGNDPENEVQAVWGYPELIDDENHYNDLIEREPEALSIFYKYMLKYKEQEREDNKYY